MAETVRFQAFIDWDADGFTAGDEVALVGVNFTRGTSDPLGRVAAVGQCTLTLNNNSRAYSPGNTGGPHYGKLLPGRPVQVKAVGTGVDVVVFTGKIDAIRPGGAAWGLKTVTIQASDAMADFQGADQLQFPVMRDVTADQALTVLTALVYGGATASATISWLKASGPAASDTVTINGQTYTFKATVAAAFDVRLSTGGSDTLTSVHLAQAINAEYNASSNWGTGTFANHDVTAVASDDGTTETVTIYSRWPGTHGNAITLAKSGANITISGAALSGGDLGTAPATDFDAGSITFGAVGDTWIMGETNGLDALMDLMNSERGRFYVKADGTLAFINSQNLGKLFTETGTALANQHDGIDASIESESIYNQVIVNFRSRRELGTAVVARAPETVEIPAGQSANVWGYNAVRTAYEEASTAGKQPPAGLVLPLTDSAGNPIGAGDLIHPVPNTDFTVDDGAEPPFDYTSSSYYRITMIRNGTSAVLYFSNSAIGSLYVRDLVIRGTGVATSEDQQITLIDWDSVDLYGLRAPITINVPFLSANEAESVARAILADYAEPYLDVRSITITDPDADIETVYTLNTGDVIALEDAQIGIDNKFMITGITIDAPRIGAAAFTFDLLRIDTVTYLILDDATFGTLDESRLA